VKLSKLMLPNIAIATLGALMMALAFVPIQRVSAGEITCVTGSPTPLPDSQAGVVAAVQELPTCTPTRARIKTHTPTTTPTEAATQTPVPATPEPTQPAATATKPGGGAEGQGVRPPDTGSGAMASGGNVDRLLLVLGSLFLVLGGGSLFVGSRRRS